MQPSPPGPPSTATRLWLPVLVLALALVVISVAILWHLRRDAIDGQARELGLLSLALTDEIGRGLQGAREGLHALGGELRDDRLPLTRTAMTQALRTRAELMPWIETLWLVDRDGRILGASESSPAPDLASFSPALQTLAQDITAVSRPFLDAHTHKSMVALATGVAHLPGQSGHSGGWIVAAIPTTALLGAFAAASPAADARMAVFRSDGAPLAGSIVTTPRLDEARVAERLAALQSVEVRRFRDGSEHLVSLHSLQRYGLKVMLTRDLDVLLSGWRETAQLTSLGLVLVLAIMALSVFLVQRADRRRNLAQQALRAQLGRTSKLESLGTLAGGVAHDFNNVLAAIVGFGEMAQDAAPQGSNQARHLERVLQAALRGKALSERILAFSRGGAHTAMVFELEPVVSEVLALLAASLRPGIVMEQQLDAREGRLRGDPTQVFEAVMNLCTNAMQAMPNGGTLGVQLERMTSTGGRVLSHSQLQAGDYLALSVSDQGTGITPAVMEHLFEPFFTTRGASAGTGLGLAVVHGVMAEFGGAIDVQSVPGQGARFTLYFPECTDMLAAPAAAPGRHSNGTGQTLLVIDDDPALVALAEEMLRGLGYEAVGFADPVAALNALRSDPQRFAAVMTDEVMPGLSGTQLATALRTQGLELPVLMVSGYGGALLAQRALAAGVSRVLTKPLRRSELARVLAELLR